MRVGDLTERLSAHHSCATAPDFHRFRLRACPSGDVGTLMAFIQLSIYSNIKIDNLVNQFKGELTNEQVEGRHPLLTQWLITDHNIRILIIAS